MAKSLTAKETERLSDALAIVEKQFDDDATADVFDYDDEYVDIQVDFNDEDDTYEQMKVERSLLSSDKTAKEIANEIC
jgi:hypothetical protein